MSQTQPLPPPHDKSSSVVLIAGDEAIQFGQVYGNVLVQLGKRPLLLYFLLGLASISLLIILWRGASFIGAKTNFLNPVGKIFCGTSELSPVVTPDPITPIQPLPTFTSIPTPTLTPIPTFTSESAPTPTLTPNCPTANDNAHLRDGPGTEYKVVGSVQVGQCLVIIARNEAGDWYKLANNTWIAAFLVNNPPQALPVATLLSVQPIAQPTPQPTTQPISQTTSVTESWAGVTDQGERISFQVAPDQIGKAAFNLSILFTFNASCPIGQVTFSSNDSAHIFEGPTSSFRFPTIIESNASANIEGAFTDVTSASGSLEVFDTRNPSERLDQSCSFRTVIKWNATKQ